MVELVNEKRSIQRLLQPVRNACRATLGLRGTPVRLSD